MPAKNNLLSLAAMAALFCGLPSVIHPAELADFGQQIRRRIESIWQPPEGSDGLEVRIRFGLDHSGKLTTVEIIRSSGNKSFDRSLLLAFWRANPFPPPPFALRERYRSVEMSFAVTAPEDAEDPFEYVPKRPPRKKQSPPGK